MVNWDKGPHFRLTSRREPMEITTIPQKLGDRDVYMHLPQTFTLKYKGRAMAKSDVEFVSHYAVLLKTRSKEIHQVESDTYCVTLKNFRDRFPDLKFKY